jgi:hypothetical protein
MEVPPRKSCRSRGGWRVASGRVPRGAFTYFRRHGRTGQRSVNRSGCYRTFVFALIPHRLIGHVDHRPPSSPARPEGHAHKPLAALGAHPGSACGSRLRCSTNAPGRRPRLTVSVAERDGTKGPASPPALQPCGHGFPMTGLCAESTAAGAQRPTRRIPAVPIGAAVPKKGQSSAERDRSPERSPQRFEAPRGEHGLGGQTGTARRARSHTR